MKQFKQFWREFDPFCIVFGFYGQTKLQEECNLRYRAYETKLETRRDHFNKRQMPQMFSLQILAQKEAHCT